MRRRVANPKSWIHGERSKSTEKTKSPTPANSLTSRPEVVGNHDIVLSLFDETYKVSSIDTVTILFVNLLGH